MGDEKAALREVHWRQVFPWLAIFRSFGVALDLKKMALGAMGVIAMALGWWILASLFEAIAPDNVPLRSKASEFKHWPWSEELSATFYPVPVMPGEGIDGPRSHATFQLVEQVLQDPLHTLWHLATNWGLVLRPIHELVHPFTGIFLRKSGLVVMSFTLLCAIWAAVVWAFFGGAITRIAAVQFAREEKISLKESVRFASSKLLSYGGAPVIPLGFIAIFWFLCAVGGLISWIPKVGDLFAGLLWLLPLIAGFVMALILVGWAVGWPLMFATISVEGSDSFDALSRSFAYAFQRPWHYLFYALLALIFGSICSFFVLLFTDLIVYLSRWAVEWGGGESLREMLDQLFYYGPVAMGWQRAAVIEEPTGVTRFAAICAAFWLYLLFFMVVGFVYSYFWSASTVIYYLLRRDVDNTEMQEVYLEGEEEDEGLPMEPAPASPVVAPQPTTPGAG